MVPSKKDIEKLNKRIIDFNKHVGEDGKLTEKKLLSMLRSAIRQVWMTSPLKLAYLLEGVIPDMDNTTRTKWLVECNICKQKFKKTDIQIDHIIGEASLKTLDELQTFLKQLLYVSKDDLQRVCISCHEAKTYSQRYNISFEEAMSEKEIIAKCKQPVTVQKSELSMLGYKSSQITNQDKRRQCYREVLNE